MSNNTIIYEDKSEEFSTYLLGKICYEIGLKKKIAIIDTNKNASKLFQTLENLSLIKEFRQHIPKLHIVTYSCKKNKVVKGMLPLVEYQTISEDRMFEELEMFDLVFIDHPNNDFLSKLSTKATYNISLQTTQKFPGEYLTQKIQQQNSLVSQENLILITPRNQGNLYILGLIFKKIMNKESINYIGIEEDTKFKPFYFFLNSLKHLPSNPRYYGKFDYVISILEKNPENESSEMLKLIKTASKKQQELILDNLDLLSNKEKIIENLEKTNSPLYIVTTNLENYLSKRANYKISYQKTH